MMKKVIEFKVERETTVPEKKGHWWIQVTIIAVAAFLVRLVLMLGFRYAVSFDEAHYLRLGASLLDQGLPGVLHPYWPPLFPLLIGLVGTVTSDFELAGRFINLLAGTGIVLLVMTFSKEIFGKSVALLAGILVAFYPPLAFNATNVMPETLYAILGLGGIYLAWTGFRDIRYIPVFLAGLCWGGAYLLRPEGVGFLLIFAGVAGFLILRDLLGKRWQSRWIIMGLFAAMGFLLLAGPYLGYLKSSTGTWTLSTKGKVNQQLEAALMFGMGEVKDPFMHLTDDDRHMPYDMAVHFGNFKELVQSDEGEKRVIQIPMSAYAQKYIRNLYQLVKFAIPHLMTTLILVLWAVGFFAQGYDPKRWGLILFLSAHVIFYWFILVPFFHVNDRYLLPLFPLAFIWVSQGLMTLIRWGSEIPGRCVVCGDALSTKRKRTSILLITALYLGLVFLPELGKVISHPSQSTDMWAEPVELKKAGEWLKANTDHPPVLMSLNKSVDYYAGHYDMRQGASFTYDTIKRNVAYARHRNVEYMVFSDRYAEWFSNLRPLVDENNPDACLERVYRETEPSGIQTVIYRILPEMHSEKENE